MYLRLLDLVRCPSCGERLVASASDTSSDGELLEGLLRCSRAHVYPVVRGIPRLLPGSPTEPHDRRTQANFTEEWRQHNPGGRTWSMDLDSRVEAFFLLPMRIARDNLEGKLVLDAGCGNGSQSVVYTRFGCEVVALDLSSGLEHGQAFRDEPAGAVPERVHFVQADLRYPPFAPGVFDIIHSAGVLHHTPDTRGAFDSLAPLLKTGGTFYLWLYKYEPIVTPLVNTIRLFTTPIPARWFARIAGILAPLFQLFCATANRLGIRAYSPLSRREAALALMDIFGAPYAHYHSFEEVADWYRTWGLSEMWRCNEGRRGFGICGRLVEPLFSDRKRETAVDSSGPALVPEHGT